MAAEDPARPSARRCPSAISTARPTPCSTGRSDSAKAGNTKEAVKLLENVTKVYKGTKTAAEAKEALDRPKQNLPLFLDRPAVKAEPRLSRHPSPRRRLPRWSWSSPSRPRATPP